MYFFWTKKIDAVETTLFVNTNESNSNISTKVKDNDINSIINQIKFNNKKKKLLLFFCKLLKKKFNDIIAHFFGWIGTF